MLHTKFRRYQSANSGEDLLRFFTKYGYGGHLGHVTSIILMNFISLYLKAYIQNLVENSSVVSKKNKFRFPYVNNFGPRSKNDSDLAYPHSFINTISCLYLPAFRSQAA